MSSPVCTCVSCAALPLPFPQVGQQIVQNEPAAATTAAEATVHAEPIPAASTPPAPGAAYLDLTKRYSHQRSHFASGDMLIQVLVGREVR